MRLLNVLTDIHGRMDLLSVALKHIGDNPLLVLGDLVDRGPESRQVVQTLMLRPNTQVIRGNHEDLMLGAEGSYLWEINGGDATLASYPDGTVWQEHHEWLKRLPYYVETEHHIFVHAGLMPGYPLQEQRPEWMSWIRERFLHAKNEWGKHIVHGHTPYHSTKKPKEPELWPERTNLDTGAYATGILTLGVFDLDQPGGPVEVVQFDLEGSKPYAQPAYDRPALITRPDLIISLDENE